MFPIGPNQRYGLFSHTSFILLGLFAYDRNQLEEALDCLEVPLEHLERYQRALLHAIVRVLEDRGHEFDQPAFPELTADIRSLHV